jgi:two-component system invasion response regulator UvrY
VIRVLIADDHALVRRGLRHMVEQLGGIIVAGEVASGDEVLGAVASTRADVLLLDVSMPGANFLELLGTLREREPRLRTLVISAHAEGMYARRAIRAGAAGYITKGDAEAELVTAIRIAGRGGRYVSPALAQELAADLATGRNVEPHLSLTNREHQVMLLLAAGNTVTQLATQLRLSVKTVSTHRSRLLAKMALSTNAELVRYALDHGLIE